MPREKVTKYADDYEILTLGRVCTALLEAAARGKVNKITLQGEYLNEREFEVTGIKLTDGLKLRLTLDPNEVEKVFYREAEGV